MGWGCSLHRAVAAMLALLPFRAEAAFCPAQAPHCLPVPSWPGQPHSMRETASSHLSPSHTKAWGVWSLGRTEHMPQQPQPSMRLPAKGRCRSRDG